MVFWVGEKMKENNSLYFALIVIALYTLLYLGANGSLFSSVSLQSNQVQYYNKPIIVSITTDLVDPNISVYFNNNLLNASVIILNNTYKITQELSSEGLLTVYLASGNESFSEVIEVRKPFVDIKQTIPTMLNKGESAKLEVRTYNPQGDPLQADSVDIDVYDPSNIKTTIFLDKEDYVFTKNFIYSKEGNYIFKINARKSGYNTVQQTVITSVLKTEGIHPIIFIWLGIIGIWIILFIIKRFKKRKAR